MYDPYYYELLNIYKPLIEHNRKQREKEVANKNGKKTLWSTKLRQKYRKK